MDQQQLQSRIGTVLQGKWTLERLIGKGSMGAVYAARHRVGHEVAIKILHRDVAESLEVRVRFDREAQVMARLTHPSAVEVRDVDVDGEGVPFIIMELLVGQTLQQRAEVAAVPPLDVLRYVEQLLDALVDAHRQSIIHRDIKPSNLFITEDDVLKVLDFGLARMVGASGPATIHGVTLGTLPYMPPEQVLGRAVDSRADLFAVGAVMYRLIARRRIHEAETALELSICMGRDAAPPIKLAVPELDPSIALVVDRALAFDVTERYQSASDMRQDVAMVRAGKEPPFATLLLSTKGAPSSGTLTASGTLVLSAEDKPVSGLGPDSETMAGSWREPNLATGLGPDSETIGPTTGPRNDAREPTIAAGVPRTSRARALAAAGLRRPKIRSAPAVSDEALVKTLGSSGAAQAAEKVRKEALRKATLKSSEGESKGGGGVQQFDHTLNSSHGLPESQAAQIPAKAPKHLFAVVAVCVVLVLGLLFGWVLARGMSSSSSGGTSPRLVGGLLR